MPCPTLAARIAAELATMASATERLGEQLCADPEVARRCLTMLQQFDLLAQQQAELGALIGRLGEGTSAELALRDVRLAALHARLGGAG